MGKQFAVAFVEHNKNLLLEIIVNGDELSAGKQFLVQYDVNDREAHMDIAKLATVEALYEYCLQRGTMILVKRIP